MEVFPMGFLNQLFTTILATADAGPSGAELATSSATAGAGQWVQLLIFIVPLALMYVILILPQRKKEKKQKETINSAIVGDQIVTIGGLTGKIVNIKDDEITFETSVERSKITVKKWAIKEVVKAIES
jgi:preprotein translocase subunit YajC